MFALNREQLRLNAHIDFDFVHISTYRCIDVVRNDSSTRQIESNRTSCTYIWPKKKTYCVETAKKNEKKKKSVETKFELFFDRLRYVAISMPCVRCVCVRNVHKTHIWMWLNKNLTFNDNKYKTVNDDFRLAFNLMQSIYDFECLEILACLPRYQQ